MLCAQHNLLLQTHPTLVHPIHSTTLLSFAPHPSIALSNCCCIARAAQQMQPPCWSATLQLQFLATHYCSAKIHCSERHVQIAYLSCWALLLLLSLLNPYLLLWYGATRHRHCKLSSSAPCCSRTGVDCCCARSHCCSHSCCQR
jgi:hypothetical protein